MQSTKQKCLSIQFDDLNTNLSEGLLSPEQNQQYLLAKKYFGKNSTFLKPHPLGDINRFRSNSKVCLAYDNTDTQHFENDVNNENMSPSSAKKLDTVFDLFIGIDSPSSVLKDYAKSPSGPACNFKKVGKAEALSKIPIGQEVKKDSNMIALERALRYVRVSTMAGRPVDLSGNYSHYGNITRPLLSSASIESLIPKIVATDGNTVIEVGKKLDSVKSGDSIETFPRSSPLNMSGSYKIRFNRLIKYNDKPLATKLSPSSQEFSIGPTKSREILEDSKRDICFQRSGSLISYNNDNGDISSSSSITSTDDTRDFVYTVGSRKTIASQHTASKRHVTSSSYHSLANAEIGLAIPTIVATNNRNRRNGLNLELIRDKAMESDLVEAKNNFGQSSGNKERNLIVGVSKHVIKLENHELDEGTQRYVSFDHDSLFADKDYCAIGKTNVHEEAIIHEEKDQNGQGNIAVGVTRHKSLLKHRSPKLDSAAESGVSENGVNRKLSMKDKFKKYYRSAHLSRKHSKNSKESQQDNYGKLGDKMESEGMNCGKGKE